MPSGGKINVTFSRKGRRIRQSMRVEHSEPLAFWTFPRLRTHESYAVDGCARTCFDYFSKTISWIVGKNKATKQKNSEQHKQVAQRPEQTGVQTAQHTLQLPGNPQRAYISAPSVRCGLLTALWLVRHIYVKMYIGNLNEATTPARKMDTKKRKLQAEHASHQSSKRAF